MYDVMIIGGGIVGLATALALSERFPYLKVLIIEKENDVGVHQTGHNSGVIHSGIYYKPGSLKARLAKEGNEAMFRFCREYGIPVERCGKVIVATEEKEFPMLQELYERGSKNGLPIEMLDREGLKKVEPHVRGLRAIHVKSVGIVDFAQVCRMMARLLQERGVELALGEPVCGMEAKNGEWVVFAGKNEYRSRFLINCAGLFSDRVAKLAGLKASVQIVPFRGEFYELRPVRKHLVKNLIYPVPDINLPFLGVHFTRMMSGKVKVGPNAVLGLKREAYAKFGVSVKDVAEIVAFPGFWKLTGRYWKTGIHEYVRSFVKSVFLRDVQRFFPEVRKEDLIPATAGVRAQALSMDGKLVDDFFIKTQANSVHVLNAPSPAATASLLIGRTIADHLDKSLVLKR